MQEAINNTVQSLSGVITCLKTFGCTTSSNCFSVFCSSAHPTCTCYRMKAIEVWEWHAEATPGEAGTQNSTHPCGGILASDVYSLVALPRGAGGQDWQWEIWESLGEQLMRPCQIWSLCFVCRAEKGRQELGGPDTQDIAGMPYRCLKAMFFPLLNEGLD